MSPLLTELRDGKASAEEPKAKLTNEVELWVDGAPDGRVMTFALTVVLPACNVHSCSAPETSYAVASVKIEPQIAHLEGCQFGNPEAADSGKGHHETIPVVPEERRPHAQEAGDDAAVDREQKRCRTADQGGKAPSPGRKLPEACDWRQ
jgi:hypothetical protein